MGCPSRTVQPHPYVNVWINGDDVKPELPWNSKKPRLLGEGDVIIVSGESRGPRCVRVTLVLVAEEERSGDLPDTQAVTGIPADRPRD